MGQAMAHGLTPQQEGWLLVKLKRDRFPVTIPAFAKQLDVAKEMFYVKYVQEGMAMDDAYAEVSRTWKAALELLALKGLENPPLLN